MTVQPPIQWSDDYLLLAEGIHTAFRKSVDNKASVIVWNAISLMEAHDWWQIIHRIATTRGPLKDRLLEDIRGRETWWEKPRGSAAALFFYGLEHLDMEDRDWESVQMYLAYARKHFNDPTILDWSE